MNKFIVCVTGNTRGAHSKFKDRLKTESGGRLSEVASSGEYDFVLAFCPVVSRLGTDLQAAMDLIPKGKPVVLVVMHHTFDPEIVLPESKRLITRQDVILTVDSVFHEERGLLDCNVNNIAIYDVQKNTCGFIVTENRSCLFAVAAVGVGGVIVGVLMWFLVSYLKHKTD